MTGYLYEYNISGVINEKLITLSGRRNCTVCRLYTKDVYSDSRAENCNYVNAKHQKF